MFEGSQRSGAGWGGGTNDWGPPHSSPPISGSQLLPQHWPSRLRMGPLTSSKTRFLARVMAELRALIHDSFSSGLTARKIRLGACEGDILG